MREGEAGIVEQESVIGYGSNNSSGCGKLATVVVMVVVVQQQQRVVVVALVP